MGTIYLSVLFKACDVDVMVSGNNAVLSADLNYKINIRKA